ncbi:MAG: c-type cytochrome [Bryobacterales bacterium]|nr:c-type cytochrome [Bryobacterales bacterium]
MRPLIAVLMAVAPAAWGQHAQDSKTKKAHPAIGNLTAIAAGAKTFAGGCAVCHGPEGQGGRGPRLAGGNAMWHSLDETQTFDLIRKGVGSGMPGSGLPDEQVWELVAFVKNLRDPAADSTLPGDAKAGSVVFWEKGGCGACHSVSGEGGKLGPDLSNIGAARSAPTLREAIVDPDADGAFGYRPTTVMLADGRQVRGVLRNFTNYSLQIQDDKGKLYLVDVRGVKDWARGDGSPMPRDYGQKLTKTDIDNLIAYLGRLLTRK